MYSQFTGRVFDWLSVIGHHPIRCLQNSAIICDWLHCSKYKLSRSVDVESCYACNSSTHWQMFQKYLKNTSTHHLNNTFKYKYSFLKVNSNLCLQSYQHWLIYIDIFYHGNQQVSIDISLLWFGMSKDKNNILTIVLFPIQNNTVVFWKFSDMVCKNTNLFKNILHIFKIYITNILVKCISDITQTLHDYDIHFIHNKYITF